MINRVLIVGSAPYDLVKQEMERFIAGEGVYLFDVVCEGQDSKHRSRSVGEIWAIENGAPIFYIFDEDGQRLLERMTASADFLMAFYDGKNVMIRRLIGMWRGAGKHGRVVRV